MKDNNFEEVINNIDNLTLGQVFKLIKKIKYRVLFSFITFLITILGGTFAAGRYTQGKSTAILLQSPFAMRIELANKTYDFSNLIVVEDPTDPFVEEGKTALSLREIRDEFDIIPIGKIIAKISSEKAPWSYIIKSEMIEKGYGFTAAEFNWNGHKNDYNFKEVFVSKTTIYRTYSDGCILAYDVDEGRKSMPSSFRWIKTNH